MAGPLVHFGYVFLILALLAYLLWAPRKELPFLLLLHGVVQYGVTVALWLFSLGPEVLGKVLVGIYAGSGLIWWSRSLEYGRVWIWTFRAAAAAGWLLLFCAGLWMLYDGPFQYQEVSPMWRELLQVSPLALHPVYKWLGSLLIFLTFFQITLHWGQEWTPARTWFSLAPLLIYFLLLFFLSFQLTTSEPAPFA